MKKVRLHIAFILKQNLTLSKTKWLLRNWSFPHTSEACFYNILRGFCFTVNNKHYMKHTTISDFKWKSFLLIKDAKNTNTPEFIFLKKVRLSYHIQHLQKETFLIMESIKP